MASSKIDEAKLPGGYLVTPRVPQGLAAAVEGLTREVIRHSPEDIYVFAADHFEKLLLLREQCDIGKDNNLPDDDGNIRTLREMSQALRTREIDRGNARPTRNTIDQMGWSLSQTAKVLKRHRSIFGEEGRRITTDEVFRMANQKENLTSSEKSPERATESREKRSSKDKSPKLGEKNVWKATTSKNERSSSYEDSLDSNKTHRPRKTGPRIITQIPNLLAKDTTMHAKDIKSELRRNRISSRERRSVRAKPEDKINVDRSDVKVTKTSGKSTKKSSERQRRLETEIEQKRGRKYTDSTRLSKERRSDDGKIEENSKKRALSMDRVKDYVVQRFATTKSLEELQPANYVEQVQEIIDETSPIIKEKIEALKSGIIGGSEKNTCFTDERKSSGSNDSSREKRVIANSSSKNSPEVRESSSKGDALRTRLTETEKLLENLSTSLGRSKRRSRSARSSRGSESIERKINEENSRENDSRLDSDNLGLATSLSKTRDLLENISSTMTRPMRRASSAKNLRKNQSTMENLEDSLGKDLLKKRLDETRNLLRGISATFGRPRSAKGSKKRTNLDAEDLELSDSETKSKVCLPAVKSISMRNSSGSASRSDSDNLVLPAISPEAPKSAKIKEDFILPVLSPSANASTNENSSRISDINDELRFDEMDIPEIPSEDCTLKIPIDNVSRDSLNVTPDFDSIPQRPDSLDPPEMIDLEATNLESNDLETKVSEADLQTKVSEVNDLESEINDTRDLEPRRQEFETVERDVGKVIASKSPEMENSDIRSKLQEIEEAEKRIDGIFAAEIHGESEKSSKGNSPVEIEENVASKSENLRIKELKTVSPEILDYTYVLTEGSPHDIPDTVTTVIFPERNQYSPLSDRINVDLQNGQEIELSEISDSPRKKSLGEDVEVVDEPIEKNSPKLSLVNIEEQANIAESAKNLIESVEEDSKDKTDVFGEYVKLESTVENSDEIDFIREIEGRQEIQISRQDLGRINEEMSEDLEGIDEETTKIVDNVAKSAESSPKEIVDGKIVEEESKENDEDRKSVVDEPEVEGSGLMTESDLSPEVTRPDIDSESSNEAKESSAAEDPSESLKREHSLDDEISSDTRTIESSNEVKETTLTDGLSLSLDPTRPFVPELNLDSLQDITVSSFKMTEDDYQNPERGESENTNSITDTLASDENNRVIDNGDFVDEAIMEYFVSSNREARENSEEEIVEDTIVKSQVEVKEDICEKTRTYVTGPCDMEENSAEETSRDIPTMEKDKDDITKTEDSIEYESLIANMEEEEDETLREDKEEMAKSEDSIKQENPEIGKTEKEEDETLREDEETKKIEDTIKQENPEILKTEKEEDENLEEDKSPKIEDSIEKESSKIIKTEEEGIANVVQEGIAKVADSNEHESEKVVATKKEEEDASSKNGEKITKTEDFVELIKVETLQSEKIENEAEEEIEESTKIAQSNENEDVEIINIEKKGTKNESQEKIECKESENSSDEKFEVDVTIKEVEKESDLENREMRVKEKMEDELERKSVEKMTEETKQTVAEENEDILEENFVEEETPLAVSRSASQCTTRRVSSGNLTKLREDPISGWSEETEREGDNIDDETSSSSRVKLFKIGDETIEEQSCEEIDLNFENNDIDDPNTKDSKEYHIYVPEVDASADNSTTDSSTFDSAVTKIQAGVRGFLTRRRLQRGQQNRSSTLSSIPSIQDSIAIEPYWMSDREPEVEQAKESGNEEMRKSPRKSEDNGIVNAATRIQSNYRGYNVRKRLRREDAVQRTTLSLEKSFAESGLQHTGEFHDCVPLPIHDISLKGKTLDAQKDSSEIGERNDIRSKHAIEDPKETDHEIASSKSPRPIDDSPKDSTPRDHDNISETSMPTDAGKMFFGPSSTVPIIQLGIAPNMGQLVDLVVLAKEEAALQSGYLNFITSVEDTEPIIGSVETPLKDFHENDKNSSGSFKEPLALSGPPIGVTIEEVTSSGAENFMKNDDEHDRTMASSLSVTAEPEVVNASSETISTLLEGHQPKSDSLSPNEAELADTGSSKPEEKLDEVFDKPDKKSDNLASARKTSISSNVEEAEKSVDENESLLEYFAVPSPSSQKKKPFFGPDSSADSMEAPIIWTHVEGTSGSPDLKVEETHESVVSPVTESSIRTESMDERARQEESIDSNIDEGSSMLSFSMKVDDLLGLGSEDSVESHGKPFLQVNPTPSHLLKTMSSSQESQLADERIESPITMIQIAPGRSESLHQDEISKNGGENDANNEKKVS